MTLILKKDILRNTTVTEITILLNCGLYNFLVKYL